MHGARLTLFFTIGQARSIFTRWVDDNNTERSHSSPGYVTPAAFAAGLEQQPAHARQHRSVFGCRWMKDRGHVKITHESVGPFARNELPPSEWSIDYDSLD
ncbi:hypothetical protein [uncultured Sphingomonas sp.]|uniref:hypothetical protein n=1 Tax=uncultured Sphingomonas sp. TaxID=158754 RepID=UPI00374A06C9